MDNFCWKAITNKGELIQQFSTDGSYVDFTKVDKKDWICFNIFNNKNNMSYGIDLLNGSFIFNGVNIIPAVQSGIFDIPCIPNWRFNYNETLFWYNQFLSQLNSCNSTTKCVNVFIGYKLPLNADFSLQQKTGKIVMVRPMLKLNALNNSVTFSTSYVFQYTDQNGQKKQIKG